MSVRAAKRQPTHEKPSSRLYACIFPFRGRHFHFSPSFAIISKLNDVLALLQIPRTQKQKSSTPIVIPFNKPQYQPTINSFNSPFASLNMDSMHPDPTPMPPPSLSDIRSQISRLEAAHKAKGFPLSGRIIHVCHHLPVEIIRVVPVEALENGLLSPPMTPEFKPEDADASVESVDAKWRIHARAGHTAMVSGMRSLSESHEQIVVAWTGEVLLQSQAQPSPVPRHSSQLPSISNLIAASDANGPTANAPALEAKEERNLMVFGGEFNLQEKKELQSELQRFSEVEAKHDEGGKLTYMPVFLPPDVSKGHYEGFCKKSEQKYPSVADISSLALIPLPLMARLYRRYAIPRPTVASLLPSKLTLRLQSGRNIPSWRSYHCSRLPSPPCTQDDSRSPQPCFTCYHMGIQSQSFPRSK